MIIKIQQSSASSDHKKHMLIYNKNKSVWMENPLTKQIRELLNKRDKAYFEVDVEVGDKITWNNLFTNIREIESQNW